MEKEQETAETRKAVAKVMGGELVELKVELFSPFVNFLKEYLRFFGAEKTLEDLCREIIYSQAEYFYNELYAFAENKSHFLDTKGLYQRFPHMTIISSQPEDEETEDC